MASSLITWNVFIIACAVSTSDNDQVKVAGRRLHEYETQCYKKQKTQSLFDKFCLEEERSRNVENDCFLFLTIL